MLVSVIMPVYNASRFLDASIGSILKQQYPHWELICVDDGSLDDSLAILQKYASTDDRIKVYSQSNAGPAQARKLGISHAAGNYISYLDSDDGYSEDYLSSTIHAALQHDADVVMPTLKMYTRMVNGEPLDFNLMHGLRVGQTISSRDAFMRTFPWRAHGFCLYRAEHLRRFALTDISNVNNYNADEYLTRYLLLYASKIVVSHGVYFYGVNDDSITRRFSTRKLGILTVNDLLFELAQKERFGNDDLQRMANLFFKKLVSLRVQVIENKENLSEDEWEEAMNCLSKTHSWESHVRLRSLKMLQVQIASVLPEGLLRFALSVRSGIRSN